jgi:uncharacterized membrane protein
MKRLRAAVESERYGIREVTLTRPLAWLAQGARDLAGCPLPGLAHGLAAAVFAAVLLGIAHDQFWLLSGAFTGFLIVAPVVATALYRISRSLEHGQRTSLLQAASVWWPRDERLVVFGVLLACAGTGWVLTSAALITSHAPAPVERPSDFLRHVVLDEETLLFEFWLLLGGVMAAPVFASSVIAIPMLLDRPVSVMTAVFTSWRVVMHNPAPLALWAGLLLALSVLGMTMALAGLVPVVPWLAHASWHAYRDLVSDEVVAEQAPAPGPAGH